MSGVGRGFREHIYRSRQRGQDGGNAWGIGRRPAHHRSGLGPRRAQCRAIHGRRPPESKELQSTLTDVRILAALERYHS